MTLKRFSLMLALLALLTAGVSADDRHGPKGFGIIGYWGLGPSAPLDDPALLDATGLDEDALKAALQEGATLTELIQANEGDVDSVIAGFVATATEAIEEHSAAVIDGLDESISEAMNETYRLRFPWWRRHNPMPRMLRAWDLHETILDATGLEAKAMYAALMDGATIAELVEANEGDVDAVVSRLVEQATERVNRSAAATIERYEEGIRETFDSEFSERRRRGPRGFFSYWRMTDRYSPAPAADSASTD